MPRQVPTRAGLRREERSSRGDGAEGRGRITVGVREGTEGYRREEEAVEEEVEA